MRTIKTRPVDPLAADRAAMLPPPPHCAHGRVGNRVRSGRDYYVRVDSNDYSVDPAVTGRVVDVTASLAGSTSGTRGASSPHMSGSGRGMTITDPAHVAAAKVLREQFQRPRPAADPHEELVRDLADYDRALALSTDWLTGRWPDGSQRQERRD